MGVSRRKFLAGGAASWVAASGLRAFAQDQDQDQDQDPAGGLPQPEPLPDVELAPPLPTRPVSRRRLGYNEVRVDSTPLPRDTEGIWVLDFVFKPVRIRTIEVPGRGRKQIYYMWYRVANRTGKPRLFVPQFILTTDTGRRYEDVVIPQAIPVIQAREEGIPLLGAVSVMGMIPPSVKPDEDEAVHAVALWENVDPRADAFSVYVRGLSDGYQAIEAPGRERQVKFKTLRVDFSCPGDEFLVSEREIRLNDPPYEWIYW